MIGVLLGMRLAAADPYPECVGTPAEALCVERKRAHDAGDMPGTHRLITREVAAVKARLGQGGRSSAIGGLLHLCLPLEAGFNSCNERRPEDGCAEGYLARYAAEGCLDDLAQRARYFNMQAMYWYRRMDHDRALAHLQTAETWAWALWLTHWDQAIGARSLVGIIVGMSLRAKVAAYARNPEALRHSLETIELLRGWLADPTHESVVADTLNDVAWSLLLAREAELTVEDPRPLLDAALRTFTERRPIEHKADNIRINLALAALHRGDLPELRRQIGVLVPERLGDEERMWLRLIELRAASEGTNLRERAAWLSDLEGIARRGRVAMARWFAAWARGLEMERLGRADAAIAAYEAGEDELDEHADAGGRSLTHADRLYLSFADGTRRLVGLLVEAGRLERALAVIRNARGRAVRVAARDGCAAGTTVGEGRPGSGPGPGVLRLIYFRVSPRPDAGAATRWVGLAVTGARIRGESLALGPIAAELYAATELELQGWADALLRPFDAEIAAASTIEILATDALHAVPFHALPWNGGSLIDAAPVQYGMDLGSCAGPGDRFWGPAVVVSGAESELVGEAGEVVAALQRQGRAAESRQPRSQAELGALLTGKYSLMHIAAHGTRPVGSEAFVSDDQLHFGAALSLSRQQILAAERAPALVFLSACQASFADAETVGGGVGLAHAFLLRGSQYVVGPTADINGPVVQAFAVRFYRALSGGGVADVPWAWRTAYRAIDASIGDDLRPHLRMLRLYAR